MRITFWTIVSILITMTSCDDGICIEGRGPVLEQELVVPQFDGIDLMVAGNVKLRQGTEQKVLVGAEANIFDRLQTNVRHGTWEINLGPGCYRDYELEIDITVSDISEVVLSGSGDIGLDNFDEQNDLMLVISGSGNMELASFSGTEKADISISGSGSVYFNSDFTDLHDLDINISGSGNIYAFPVETKNCYVSIPGSGNCEVRVTDLLDANISGSGNIFYKGNPTIKSIITGSGAIINTN